MLHRIDRSLSESVEHSLPHLPMLGIIGCIGFPLYYWLWGTVFPQPYENLTLRLIGSALFFGLLTINWWTDKYKKYIKFYWCLAFLYSLSFFFTFMLLKNQGNFVWAMSMMAGLTLLILLAYDWVLVTSLFIVGSIIAIIAYMLTSDTKVDMSQYWMQIPIYLFLVIFGSAFNYESSRTRQEKLKMLAAVGAEVTHELRTPLLSIEYNSKKVKQSLVVKDQRDLQHALQNILDETMYANTIIDMLLMNLGRGSINSKNFAYHSMLDIVNSAIKRYPFRSYQEQAKIKVHGDGDFFIWAADILIVHVLFNLIKNALLHSAKDDQITIAFDSNNHANQLIFTDTGTGIPANKIAYIFDDFYSSSELGAGTGIGLSFCKKVMQNLTGAIVCESVLGEFTRFTLSFPLVNKADSQVKSPATTAKKQHAKQHIKRYLQGINILLVDDEDIHHILFNEAVDCYDINVFHAYSTADALHLLEQEAIDCIVIDIHMPVMNGLEFTQTIRSGSASSKCSQYASVPIIGLTSDPSEQVRKNAYLKGMNAFLSKPVQEPTLTNTLLTCLKNTDITVKVQTNDCQQKSVQAEDSRLYKLGAKLVHDMATPIATVRLSSHVFAKHLPTLIKYRKQVICTNNISAKTVDKFSQSPSHYLDSMVEIRQCLDAFWQKFHKATIPDSKNLLTLTIDTLTQYWQDLDNANQLFLRQLLPMFIALYTQGQTAEENTEQTDTLISEITQAADNCQNICQWAQQVLVSMQQELGLRKYNMS